LEPERTRGLGKAGENHSEVSDVKNGTAEL
jgi:hypothetical protein